MFLTQDQFRDAIRKGLGRAILHLKHHRTEPYMEEVIYVCTHSTAYDTQCEGSRDKYLRRAIALSGRQSEIRKAILDALSSSTEYYSTCQLFSLACGYAAKGDGQARQRIYEKFDRNDAAEPFIGASAIIELDGIAGLLYAARKVGQEVMRGNVKGDVHLVENASDYVEEQNARDVLAQEALHDPAIKAYLGAVETEDVATRSQIESGYRTGRSFAELFAEFDTGEASASHIQWRHWARTATPGDLRAVALQIERETDPDRLFKFLSAFMGKTRYPLAPDRLVELTSSMDQKLAYRAVIVLRGMRHHRARQLFFELLSSRRNLRIVFGLLQNNFVPGDEQLISGWLEANITSGLSDEQIHGIGLDLRSVFEHNEVADIMNSMLWVYESTPCSLCRSGAVEILIQDGAVNDDLLHECRYDCDENTRKQAVHELRKRRIARNRPGA